MIQYANHSRRSSIESYLITEHSIKIQFRNNRIIYVYSSIRNGHHVAEMKRFAKSGEGLGAYIAKRKKTLLFTKE